VMPADRVQTFADSSEQKVSAAARARCVKEKGDRIDRTTYKESVSKCQQQCQQITTLVLTHTDEEPADIGDVKRTRLARFKRFLKRGPKLGSKELARFVVEQAAKNGLLYGTQRAQ
jgi:hypothetical protein